MNKRIISGAVVAGVVASMGLVGSAALAQSTTNGDTLAARIASKFNLNQSEVETVLKDFRSEKDADRQQRMSERLAQAVTDGKITAEQKSAIESKMAELKTRHEEIHAMSDQAARKAAMEALRSETEQWKKDNGIPDGILFGPGFGSRARGMGMRDGMRTSDDGRKDIAE